MLITIEKRIMPTSDIIKRLGGDERGKVQRFATEQIRVRMKPYMPWRTGFTATDLTYSDSPTTVLVAAPYARYLYNGVSRSGNPLNYTHTVNPMAGPRWDRTMAQREGAKIAQAIEAYAKEVSR